MDTSVTLTTKTAESVENIKDRLPEQYEKIESELGQIKKLLLQQKGQNLLPNWLTQSDEIMAQPVEKLIHFPSTVIIMNQPHHFNMPTATGSGQTQMLCDSSLTIANQTTNVTRVLNRLDSPDFENDELIKVNNEIQQIYDSLDAQKQAELKVKIKEMASSKAENPTFKEKLKKWATWTATQGWDITKSVLIEILKEVATKGQK